MNRWTIIVAAATLAATGIGPFATAADAGPNRVFHEDFTTTTFKDTGYTDALWDTVAGEITLPPFSMTVNDTIGTPGLAYGVTVRGKYAYVADLTGDLQVFDVNSVTNLQPAGSYGTPSSVWDLDVSGNHAYLACGSSGLHIADISDPTNPAAAGSYNTPGYSHQVCVAGNFAYVADGANGLQVIDITDPTTPVVGGNYNSPGGGLGIAIEGNHAYLGDGTSGLRVIDIANPTAPVSAGSVALPGTSRDIVIAGNAAYVASDLGVQVVDITDPALPVSVGSFSVSSNARGVAVIGDYLYIAADALGVIAVDISVPSSPVALDTIDTAGLAWRLSVAGETAIVADGVGGLVSLDVAGFIALAPVLAGETAPFYASASAVSGDYAYVLNTTPGFSVVDISDPTSPVQVASMATSGGGRDVVVRGDHVYTGNIDDGLLIVDVSDPLAPAIAGSLGLPSSMYGLEVEGDYAYIADNWAGLQIVDVSDPTLPAFAGSLAVGGQSVSIAVDGDVAFVGLFSGGLVTVDVSDPTNPVAIGSEFSFSNAYGMEVSGDYLYVLDRNYGIRAVDVSDPALPFLAGSTSFPASEVAGISMSGKWAMVTVGTKVYQIKLTSPSNPVIYGEFDNVGGSAGRGADTEGDHLFFSDANYGLRSLQIFDRSFDQSGALMRSIIMDVGPDSLVQVRLTSTEVDRIDWSVFTSLIGGNLAVVPGEWQFTSKRDHYLQWRAYQYISSAHVAPSCSDLSLEWLFDFPVIDSVLDVPNDQGRAVRISFTRSGWDAAGSATPIHEYAVFRKVDPALTKTGGSRSVQGLPPGAWDFVATVPADGDDQYSTIVPSLADSTSPGGQYMTTYLVRARTGTPAAYFDSYVDSGYSVDNLSPGVPFNFKVAYGQGGANELTWGRSSEVDFQYFRVYRDTLAEFVPTATNRVHSTADTSWSDPIPAGYGYHYKVSAVDFSGNESDGAVASEFTSLGNGGTPSRFALHGNSPNPFNPTTEIRYSVPVPGGEIALQVFDVGGRLIRTLARRFEPAGKKSVAWDGRDDAGENVASGIYIYRLKAADYDDTGKMMLVR